jgi:hypothetical protein
MYRLQQRQYVWLEKVVQLCEAHSRTGFILLLHLFFSRNEKPRLLPNRLMACIQLF